MVFFFFFGLLFTTISIVTFFLLLKSLFSLNVSFILCRKNLLLDVLAEFAIIEHVIDRNQQIVALFLEAIEGLEDLLLATSCSSSIEVTKQNGQE